MKHVSPYLSAEALGLREDERDGLIALMRDLDRGLYRLNMRSGVGPIGCIGYYLGRQLGDADYMAARHSAALRPLFYPCPLNAYDADASQAAAAIRNLLTRGQPHWQEVMEAVMEAVPPKGSSRSSSSSFAAIFAPVVAFCDAVLARCASA